MIEAIGLQVTISMSFSTDRVFIVKKLAAKSPYRWSGDRSATVEGLLTVDDALVSGYSFGTKVGTGNWEVGRHSLNGMQFLKSGQQCRKPNVANECHC